MTSDAEIMCRKEPFGVVCQWIGGNIATVYAEDLRYHAGLSRCEPKIGQVVKFGGLKLRIVDRRWDFGAGSDSFYAALAHNPNAELQVLYRSAVWQTLRIVCNLEQRIHGFMLKRYEGKLMPFTDWLYRKLL